MRTLRVNPEVAIEIKTFAERYRASIHRPFVADSVHLFDLFTDKNGEGHWVLKVIGMGYDHPYDLEAMPERDFVYVWPWDLDPWVRDRSLVVSERVSRETSPGEARDE